MRAFVAIVIGFTFFAALDVLSGDRRGFHATVLSAPIGRDHQIGVEYWAINADPKRAIVRADTEAYLSEPGELVIVWCTHGGLTGLMYFCEAKKPRE